MIIYNKPTVMVTYNREKEFLHLIWNGYTIGSEFREALDLSFDFMLKESIYRVLSDITTQRVVSPHEQEYTRDKVIQFYKLTGSFKSAFLINPKSVSTTCAIRYSKLLQKESGKNLNSFFDSEETALNWLLSDKS